MPSAMKKALLSCLATACICLMLPSCSKSLTDIGYEPGIFGTYNANDVPLHLDDLSSSNFLRNRSMALPSFASSLSFFRTANPYTGNPNMSGVDKELLEKTAEKQCVAFARKFYSSLQSPKFRAKKFPRRFQSSCIGKLKEAVDSAASENDRYQGWQIFMAEGFEPDSSVNVAYSGDAWFKVCRTDNPDICIYIQMVMTDIKKDPKIIQIKYRSGRAIPDSI